MNALAACSSPYLRQHADNPVAWVPWSAEAFAEARRRDVPVLVSIGYSTCHWCHVMAHESFEDPATAAQMNRQFVCIKVDREEHPEVDAIYMDAVQALTGHGGWPLNAFCDHDGRPFYAGTYFPRERWRGLCDHLAGLWLRDRPRIGNAAAEITRHLADRDGEAGDWPADAEELLAAALDRGWDGEHPGWGSGPQRAPKFPPSQLLNLLVTDRRPALRARAAAVLTAMQDAGLHDRVGGGFHRYSVDRAWRLPHFEKMLYDNAQLAVAYATAGTVLGRPDFTRTACAIGDYLLRDLRVVDAGTFVGYAAAEDADDPGGEGAFYAWSPAQLAEALGDDAGRRLAEAWDLAPGAPEIGPHGHADPVLSHIPHPRSRPVTDADRLAWDTHHAVLRGIRDRRPRPGRDDKVLTDQNGLALEAFAALARHTGEARFIAACRELADVLAVRHPASGLLRLADRPAYITDYGSLAWGLLAAFDALGDPALVDRAERIAAEAVARLRADDGGFYATPAGRGDLIRRGREQTDHAQPAGIHALAAAFGKLAAITGDPQWRRYLDGILAVQAGMAGEHPTACATLLAAARWRTPRLAVICGPAADPGTEVLAQAARRHGDGAVAIIPVEAPRPWPCLDGRRGLPPQVLVCLADACLAPARTPAEVAERLAQG